MGAFKVIAILICLSINAATSHPFEEVSLAKDGALLEDNGVLRTYMEMQINTSWPDTHPTTPCMFVKCWSGNDNIEMGCFDGGTGTHVYKWDFTAWFNTVFECYATWGTASLPTFSVFGNDVPSKSSVWQVNFVEKIRLSEDGRITNDYREPWQGEKPTPEPTTTIPTTTTPTTTTPTTTTPTTTPTTTTPTTTTPTTTTPTTTPTTTTPTTTPTTTTPTTTPTTTTPTTTTPTTTTPTTTTITPTTTTPTTTTPTTTTPTTTTQATTTPTTTSISITTDGYDFDCSVDGLFPDPCECSIFHSCDCLSDPGHCQHHVMPCPEDLVFCEASQVCENPGRCPCENTC